MKTAEKMIQIRIRAIGKFFAEAEQDHYIDPKCSAVVSCTDKAIDESRFSQIPHCCLYFLDTEDPRNPKAFTHEDAAVIRRFLESLPENITTLYCCCDWGQSRSTGLAAACMTAIGQDCEAVFRNPAYTPNLLVYAYMCEALGCGLPSKARLNALRALCTASAAPDRQTAVAINRILVIGDATFFGAVDGGCEDWPSFLAATLLCKVEDRRIRGKMIPFTEKELISDKHDMGRIFPGDLLIVLLGRNELQSAVTHSAEGRVLEADLASIRAKMRKYLVWLKYVNQGASLLLISPCARFKGKDGWTEAVVKLADCYCSLAAELRIGFLDLSRSNQENLISSSKNSDEVLAAYIMSHIEKTCVKMNEK